MDSVPGSYLVLPSDGFTPSARRTAPSSCMLAMAWLGWGPLCCWPVAVAVDPHGCREAGVPGALDVDCQVVPDKHSLQRPAP